MFHLDRMTRRRVKNCTVQIPADCQTAVGIGGLFPCRSRGPSDPQLIPHMPPHGLSAQVSRLGPFADPTRSFTAAL